MSELCNSSDVRKYCDKVASPKSRLCAYCFPSWKFYVIYGIILIISSIIGFFAVLSYYYYNIPGYQVYFKGTGRHRIQSKINFYLSNIKSFQRRRQRLIKKLNKLSAQLPSITDETKLDDAIRKIDKIKTKIESLPSPEDTKLFDWIWKFLVFNYAGYRLGSRQKVLVGSIKKSEHMQILETRLSQAQMKKVNRIKQKTTKLISKLNHGDELFLFLSYPELFYRLYSDYDPSIVQEWKIYLTNNGLNEMVQEVFPIAWERLQMNDLFAPVYDEIQEES